VVRDSRRFKEIQGFKTNLGRSTTTELNRNRVASLISVITGGPVSRKDKVGIKDMSKVGIKDMGVVRARTGRVPDITPLFSARSLELHRYGDGSKCT
jgi:hypothetical protein